MMWGTVPVVREEWMMAEMRGDQGGEAGFDKLCGEGV